MTGPVRGDGSSIPASLRGGLWMMAAALSFTIMTTLIRDVASEVHPFEIAFFRVLTNLLLMMPFVLRTGRAILRSSNHWAYILRGIFGFLFLMTYFPGAAMVPVSDSQALIFTSPLFATAMAVLFLGERVRTRRVTALIVGFCGAIIILRPGFDAVNIGAFLVIIGAFANAGSNVIVRHTTRTDHPDTAVFYLMLYVLPLITVPALFVWTTPTLAQLVTLVSVGFFATLNQRFLSRAFAAAEATTVLPFDFARLPFAALIGWIVFAEVPDIWVWVGGAIIFMASIYIAHREARASRTSE
jgi:drug/metabolite transporter (DMT)-like permease